MWGAPAAPERSADAGARLRYLSTGHHHPMTMGWFETASTERQPLSPKVREAVYDRAGGHCERCGCTLTPVGPNQMHVDHIRPLAQGGHPTSLDNLQALCRSCNLAKGARYAGGGRTHDPSHPDVLAERDAWLHARAGTVVRPSDLMKRDWPVPVSVAQAWAEAQWPDVPDASPSAREDRKQWITFLVGEADPPEYGSVPWDDVEDVNYWIAEEVVPAHVRGDRHITLAWQGRLIGHVNAARATAGLPPIDSTWHDRDVAYEAETAAEMLRVAQSLRTRTAVVRATQYGPTSKDRRRLAELGAEVDLIVATTTQWDRASGERMLRIKNEVLDLTRPFIGMGKEAADTIARWPSHPSTPPAQDID